MSTTTVTRYSYSEGQYFTIVGLTIFTIALGIYQANKKNKEIESLKQKLKDCVIK